VLRQSPTIVVAMALVCLTGNRVSADGPSVVGQKFKTCDSLAIAIETESNADSRDCLEGLRWPASEFAIDCELSKAWRYDSLVRFPSAIDTGDSVNDRVALEWHMARDANGDIITAPAVLVIHESGSNMAVGKTLAMLISRHGLHAFMIHLPGYGERRSETKPKGAANLIRMTRQSIIDVRRSRDVIAAMPMIESDLVALQGTSLGGFIGSTAASLDNCFNGVFLMLCGGDLYDVLQHGKRDAENMRRQLANEGLSGEDLRKLLHTIEPTRIAHRLPPERTWLFSGRFDTVVPLSNANLLASAIHLSDDHHVIYDVDHYSGVVRIPEMVQRIQKEVQSIAAAKSPPSAEHPEALDIEVGSR
jgi:hypothetical protein